MSQQTYKSASRRYWRAFIPIMAIYLLATLAGTYYLNTFETEPVILQVAIAIACTLPIIGFLIIMIRYFLETDEYNRLIQLKGFSIGSAVTLSGIFLFGFLQMFDVIGYVEVFWFGPFAFIAYGVATYLLGGRQCL